MTGVVLQQQNLNIGRSSELSNNTTTNTTPQKSPYRRLLKKQQQQQQQQRHALKRKAAAVREEGEEGEGDKASTSNSEEDEDEDDLEIEESENVFPPRKRVNPGSPRRGGRVLQHQMKREIKRTVFVAPTVKASVRPAAAATTTTATTTSFGEWQRHHKRKFPTFTFYLDGVDGMQKKRLMGDIARLRGSVEPFFSKRVTHIITARTSGTTTTTTHSRRNSADEHKMTLQEMAIKAPYGSSKLKLPQQPNDEGFRQDVLVKAKEFNLHIWSIAKATSILDALLRRDEVGVVEAKVGGDHHGDNLAKALRDERVYGTKERDVNAKQEQFVSFRGPFIIARDLNNVYQPIVSREYKKVDEARNGEWPQFRATSNGRCPFVVDPYVARQQHQSTSAKIANKENTAPKGEPQEGVKPATTFKPPPVPAILQKSAAANRPAYRPPPDVDASGVVNSSNLNSVLRTQTSTTTTTSNAARTEAFAQPSKEVRDLTRKVLKAGFSSANDPLRPPRPPVPSTKSSVLPAKKPDDKLRVTSATNTTGDGKVGYCENCRLKFDHYNLVRF